MVYGVAASADGRPAERVALHERSSLVKADRVQGPTGLMHGASESRACVSQVVHMAQALRA